MAAMAKCLQIVWSLRHGPAFCLGFWLASCADFSAQTCISSQGHAHAHELASFRFSFGATVNAWHTVKGY